MKKVTGVLLLLFLVAGGISALENINLYGRLTDYAWANASNRVAVLFVDPNESAVIYIRNAEETRGEKRIFLSDTIDYNGFDWTASDDGFILSGPKFGEFPYCSFFRFVLEDHSFSEVYENVERGQEYIDNVAVDSTTGQWAAAYSGEGRPDVYFYNNETLLSHTDAYPGIITLVGWKDGDAYCMSDVLLDIGFTREEREKAFNESAESRQGTAFRDSRYYVDERLRLYRIDPIQAEAEESDLYYKDLIDTSFDGSYQIDFSQMNLPDSVLSQITITLF